MRAVRAVRAVRAGRPAVERGAVGQVPFSALEAAAVALALAAMDTPWPKFLTSNDKNDIVFVISRQFLCFLLHPAPACPDH